MSYFRTLTLSHVVLVCLALTSRGNSAGPLLLDADRSLKWLPEATFQQELDRLAPVSCEFRAVPPPSGLTEVQQSHEVEINEIKAELERFRSSQPSARSKAPTDDRALSDDNPPDTLLQIVDLVYDDKGTVSADPQTLAPPGFPAEFAVYVQGLGDYNTGHPTAARARWETIMSWPQAQRRHRSVWAAYMIGKSWLLKGTADDDGTLAQNAIDWFRKTRELARAGFPDPLGLAASSLCWEASAEWELAGSAPPDAGEKLPPPRTTSSQQAQHIIRGIHLYLQAYAAGQPHAGEALQQLCQDLLNRKPELLAELTLDEKSADLVTSFILAHGGKLVAAPKSNQVERWLEAVKSAPPLPDGRGVLADRLGTDRLLWACCIYDLDRDTAAHWRSRSVGRPLSDWIWAKICLDSGASHIDEAVALMTRAGGCFPPDQVWLDVRGGGYDQNYRCVFVPRDRVNAELGVLELARGRYETALDLLMGAGWWEDAAYIAECVLTPEELVRYVDSMTTASVATRFLAAKTQGAISQILSDRQHREQIRGVLARRLTRLGRWKQARPYFNDADRATLDSYVAAIRAGHDTDRSDDDRAVSFWNAARIARSHGQEIFGHETSPADQGWYERHLTGTESFYSTIVGSRQHPRPESMLGATPDEITRVKANAPHRYSRRDERYVAADHAWSAAQLMPDESDETARVLCIAGNWLIVDDPKAALRFYRALIDRCATTELGRKAAANQNLPGAP
jgi:hypothetical protein